MVQPRTDSSRREFLARTAIAGVALAAPHIAMGAARNEDDIRIGVIGLNGRGTAHIDGYKKRVTALCDVDQKVLERTAKKYAEKIAPSVSTFTDYRKLLERDDIDAVSIATPNHTHSLIAIEAMQAGKDVYVEKPVSHNVWEGRQLALAAQQFGKIVQCGTQARSSRGLQEAVAWVQGGGLGAIQYALGTCYKPRQAIGKLDSPLEIPSSIDYDMWCGPADKVDLYRPRLHYDWHWDYNTGAGDMGNQGIHQMDVARWFLGEAGMAPRTLSIGARLGYEDAANTANTQIVLHDYDAAPLLFETRGLPRSKEAQSNWGRGMDSFRGSGIGVLVQCAEGHVLADAGYRNAYAFDRSGKQVKHFRGGGDHFQNFVEAVAQQDPSRLNGPVREGHVSSALCHAGNVSHRIGKLAAANEIARQVAANPLLAGSYDRMAAHLRANDVDIDSQPALVLGEWISVDPHTETLVDNTAGQDYWKREGRAGFRVPDLEVV